MIICFECNKETKDCLDKLVATGAYRDLSEVITVSIANQSLLHSRGKEQPAFVIADSGGSIPNVDDTLKSNKAKTGRGSTIRRTVMRDDQSRYGIPDIFRGHPVRPTGPIAEPTPDVGLETENISLGRWVFGQYNKLLPVKASCRALANLLTDDKGVELQSTARRIASEAAELGAHLLMLDRRHRHPRDELLSTAFPGHADPDKGRIRYANQFVVSVNKQGTLAGLPVDLKLINRIPGRNMEISLTSAGWTFALMDSPVLDDDIDNPTAKFSNEETSFLLEHIAANVPVEQYAYRKIISAILEGHDTPEKLRAALQFLEDMDPKVTSSFFATQRAGAISRMADLSLLYRDRDGIRVRYIVTDEGQSFRQRKIHAG